MIMRPGVELTEVKDVDVLLERILREACRRVGAEAGSISMYRRDHIDAQLYPERYAAEKR